MNKNTFGNYKFDNWIPEKIAEQIIEFWGCMGRTYKDWLEDAKAQRKSEGRRRLPQNGDKVIFYSNRIKSEGSYFYEKIEGRFIHAWNNMGRVIKDDMTYSVVSSCDDWIFKDPEMNINKGE